MHPIAPHSELISIENNLWIVNGHIPNTKMRRRMAVVKQSNGRLVLHSVVAMEAQGLQQLEALGEPEFMIVPNRFHRLDAAFYKEKYPNIKVICPKESQKAVEKKIKIDGHFDLLPKDDHLLIQHFSSVKTGERGLIIKNSEGGHHLIVTDLIFNVPKSSGVMGFLIQLLGSTGAPKVTPLFRLYAVSDKKLLGKELEQLATTFRLKSIIMAHGKIIKENASEVLRTIGRSLQGL